MVAEVDRQAVIDPDDRLQRIAEIADAAEESLRISVLRMAATVTSGNGTAVTPVPMDSADSAAGASCECNGATVATTSGATTIIEELGWNVRNTPFEPDRKSVV